MQRWWGGRQALGAAVMASFLSACDGSSAPLENASVCDGAWQTFVSAKAADLTSSLVYEDDALYYAVARTSSLLAQPISGGPPTTLAQAFTQELWAEGDHLLYTQGNLGNQIFSLPIAGGAPELVLDTGAGRTNPGVALFHAFTPTDVYWTEVNMVDQSTNVWHASRSDGTTAQMGTVSFTEPATGDMLGPAAMALTTDGVLLATISGLTSLIPFNAGPARPLANPSPSFEATGASLLGVDSSGAYWLVPRPGTTADEDTWTVIVAPADGSPVKTFWQVPSPHSGIQNIWPSGQGGWVMVGAQLFDDHLYHTTIWLLESGGTATRLACSPGVGSASFVEVPVTVAPEAVYAITNNLAADTYEIDRIAR